MDTFDECSLLRFLSRHRQMPMARVSEAFNTCDRRTETVAAPLIVKRLITATPFRSYLDTLDIMYQVRGWRVFTMQDPNYIERAISFITEHGMLTSSQLHAMLGLEPDDMPSEVLAEALDDGRLIKDGKEWTLGAGQAVELAVGVVTYIPSPAAVLAFPAIPVPVQPKPRPIPQSHRSKIDLAVEFLRSQPACRASSSQMCVAIGLSVRHGAAAHLRTGVESGRLARANGYWVLGEKERMAA